MGDYVIKKCISVIILVFILLLYVVSHAEDSFISTVEDIFSQMSDLSNKNTVSLSTTNFDPSYCYLYFDFTNDNQSIAVIDGKICKVFYHFDDSEQMSLLLQMIHNFIGIEKKIPEGRKLQYILRFSETEIHFITSDTMSKYYSWINKN